jgi:hypothetical protein
VGLIRAVRGTYRDERRKGRLYVCVAPIASKSVVIARPLYDGKDERIPADVGVESTFSDAFDHVPFDSLGFKSDEEYLVMKAKRRPVLALTGLLDGGIISVAPVYTLSMRYKNLMDLQRLRANDCLGVLYFAPDEFYENERFASLGERFPTYGDLLQPRPQQLTREGMELLDRRLAQLDQLYQDATE